MIKTLRDWWRNLWKTSKTSENKTPFIYRIPEDLSIDQRKMLVHGLIRRHNAYLYNPEADSITQFSQRHYTLSTLEDVWLCDRVFTNVSRNSREVRDFFTIRYPTEEDLMSLNIIKCRKYLGEFGND